MSEEKLLELLDEAEKERDDDNSEAEEAGEPSGDGTETGDERTGEPCPEGSLERELEFIIHQLEESLENKKSQQEGNTTGKEKAAGARSQRKEGDNVLRDIVSRINRKFGRSRKQKGRINIPDKSYILQEFFQEHEYGIRSEELFSYLGTGTVTDVYRKFYDNEKKEEIYTFGDDLISYDKMCRIQSMAKMAHFMGYAGNIDYCGHEQLDADTKERWSLIRNMSHVIPISFLRYELSMS